MFLRACLFFLCILWCGTIADVVATDANGNSLTVSPPPGNQNGHSSNGLDLSNDQQEFIFRSNAFRLSIPGGPSFVLPQGFQIPPELAARLQGQAAFPSNSIPAPVSVPSVNSPGVPSAVAPGLGGMSPAQSAVPPPPPRPAQNEGSKNGLLKSFPQRSPGHYLAPPDDDVPKPGGKREDSVSFERNMGLGLYSERGMRSHGNPWEPQQNSGSIRYASNDY